MTPVSEKELSKHNSEEDLWVAIDGLVYDVSEWQFDHPGGADVLLTFAGKDATEFFKSVAHSLEALEIRKKYVVGRLVPTSKL